MSFQPVQVKGRNGLGAEFAYSVVFCQDKERKEKRAKTRFMIQGKWTRKAKWQNGDILRLEVDAESRLARFVVVMKSGPGAKAVAIREPTKRGWFEIAWTGDIPSYFPKTPPKESVELNVIEVSTEGLTFELPKVKA